MGAGKKGQQGGPGCDHSRKVSMERKEIIRTVTISKSFHDPVTTDVLKSISFEIGAAEFVSIAGKSGCGKSTLLYILSTMDTEYSGDLYIDGELMKGKSDAQLANIRNEKIGFVFQFHYLLNEFSVIENVMLPGLKLGKLSHSDLKQLAAEKLRTLDIIDLANKRPNQLSGGQKQRVSIARALINNPAVVICDEPTGNLDKTNSGIVFDLFKKLSAEHGQTLLVVTHDMEFARRTDRIIKMDDGRIVV